MSAVQRTVVALVLLAACAHPAPPVSPATAATQAPAAKSFSMRMYVVVFLHRGPAWSAEETEASVAIGEGHMAHIRAMGESGKLLIAGPFDQPADAAPGAIAGILVFDVATVEEARALASDDPAVKAGRFTLEVLPWYGPSGLTYDGHVRPPGR